MLQKVKCFSFPENYKTNIIITVMDNVKTVIADTFWKRLKGVKALKNPAKGTRILLPNRRVIHTFGVRYDLQVRFLDKDGRELKRVMRLKPGKIVIGPVGTAATEETIL